MTEATYRRYRRALRSVARLLILDLERRGFTLRVVGPKVQARPSRQLTDLDRWTIRQHADDVRLLVEHRTAWTEWPQPVPKFDPRNAFLSNEDIRGRTA